MLQPFDSEDAPFAPMPVLTGQMHDIPLKEPSIVRNARILCIMGMVLCGIAILGVFIGIFIDFASVSDLTTLSVLLFYITIFAFVVWLYRGLIARSKSAWQAQTVVSLLGLLGFPLGTLIHGQILSKWFKPDVKSWFGLLAPPEFNR